VIGSYLADMTAMTGSKSHYVRKPHLKCDCMKNRDAQITRLYRCVSQYRVIGDTRPGASLISIHWRCVKSERISDYKTHPRCALRVRVTDLIPGWGSCGINTRRTKGHASPTTKKSETCFILARHRFNCRLESLCH
jgi:hypothetical protein